MTRGRKSAALKPQIDAIFDARSQVLYGSMANRKRIKEAGGLPFTLAEFRAWLLDRLGGSVEGVVKCAYCTAWLNIAIFVPDHIDPLARGGSFGLSNLAPCCKSCNLRKGRLTAEGFKALIEFLLGLDPWDMNDVLGRLATGGEGAKMMWKRNAGKRLF